MSRQIVHDMGDGVKPACPLTVMSSGYRAQLIRTGGPMPFKTRMMVDLASNITVVCGSNHKHRVPEGEEAVAFV